MLFRSQTMGRSTDEKGADKAVAIRRSQGAERARLLKEIDAEQKKITALNDERAPIAAEVRKVEADVGPIKYIAKVIYGDNPDANILEKAVSWVIMIIVAVFDPLALCLILAGNKQLEWAMRGKGGWVHDDEEEVKPVEVKTPEQTPTDPLPAEIAHEPEEHPLTEEEREAKEQQELEQFLWRGKMIAKALDADEAERAADEGNALLAEIDPEGPDVDALLSDLEAARAEETKLKAERQQQSELLDTLADELRTLDARVTEAEKAKTTLEAELQQSERLKADLKSAFDATTSSMTATEQQRLLAEKNLADAGNTIARLNIEINSKTDEINTLNQWVQQLQEDLQAAVALAAERNVKVNELMSQLPQPEQIGRAHV